MFGDLSNMMANLKEAQQKVEETKARLDTVLIEENTDNGKIKVVLNANCMVKSISISNELTDYEEIEDFLIIAMNKALKRANSIKETELAEAAKNGMPNIPGMDLFK